MEYFASIASLTNYHERSGVAENLIPVSARGRVGQKPGHIAWQLMRPIARRWQSCVPWWRLWARIHTQAHSGSGPALTTCSCRAEVPIFFSDCHLGLIVALSSCLLLLHALQWPPSSISGWCVCGWSLSCV